MRGIRAAATDDQDDRRQRRLVPESAPWPAREGPFHAAVDLKEAMLQ
jgi:hypothetical protein